MKRGIKDSIFRNKSFVPVSAFFLFALCGILGIQLTIRPLPNNSFALGKEMISMFIPFLMSMTYLIVLCVIKSLTFRTLLLVFSLFVVLVLPFKGVLGDPIEYHKKDDAFIYSLTAKNMVEAQTLWCGDGLLTGNENVRHFTRQPGYRYYVAMWILLFGTEQRLFQFINMGIYVVCMALLLHKSLHTNLDTRILSGTLAFLFLSAPFAAKMILMGIAEWLALVLLMFGTIFFVQKKYAYSAVFFALAPFMRQNLLIVSALFFIILLLHSNKKILLSLWYFMLILLPLWHNIYYGHALRFFADYGRTEKLMLFSHPDSSMFLTTIKNVLYHLSLYSGIDYRSDLHTNLVAVTFIPFGTLLVVYMGKRLGGILRYAFWCLISFAVAPTLFFGWAYYPRFEFVNLFVAVLSYIILCNSRLPGLCRGIIKNTMTWTGPCERTTHSRSQRY